MSKTSKPEAKRTEEEVHDSMTERYLGGGGKWRRLSISSNGEVLAVQRGGSAAAQAVTDALKAALLPVNYPHSVRPEYLEYQLHDTLQALCSYLRGVLSTRAVLQGIGVGSANASPLAAAMVWVLKDGLGMLAGLILAAVASEEMDCNLKVWRLVADIANDVGLTLDMLASVLPSSWFIYITCLSTLCKTVCGVSAGATKSAITAHFAIQGNIADLSTKEGTQETAVTLLGLLSGVLCAQLIGDSLWSAWLIFIVLTVVHVYANYRAVKALVFDSINRQRCFLLTKEFCVGGQVLDPCTVASRESLWMPAWLGWYGPKLGVSIQEILAGIQHINQGSPSTASWRALKDAFSKLPYLIGVDQRGRLCVALREDVGENDMLQACFHASYLLWHFEQQQRSSNVNPGIQGRSEQQLRCSEIVSTVQRVVAKFEQFYEQLPAHGWQVGGSKLRLGASNSWRYRLDDHND